MPKIFQRNDKGNWYVRIYTNQRDKWISLRTNQKREAERRAARLLYADLPKAIQAISTIPAIRIDEVWQEYIQTPEFERLKDSTAENNRISCEKLEQWCIEQKINEVDKITLQDARDYLSYLSDEFELANKTLNNHKQTLSGIWNALGIDDNPWKEIKNKALKTKPMRPFSDDEIAKILAYVENKGGFWYYACVVSLYTGLRLQDVVKLKWDELKENLKYIEMTPAKTERTGRSVYIPIHSALKKCLSNIKRNGNTYLFPDQVETYQNSRQAIADQFRNILKRLKIKANNKGRVGFHSFRDTFATHAAINGVPRDHIRAMVGHTGKAMTNHYIDSPETLSVDQLPEYKK